VLGRSVHRGGGYGLCWRSVGRRENPPGADVDHDELHDDLQFAGRDMPNHLFSAAGAGGRFDNDRTGPGSWSQSDGKHVVHHELHDDAAHLSDELRQNIAFAVIGPA
jgi:hypothetical protein